MYHVPETLFSFEKFSFLVLALAKFSFLVLALANFSVLIVWTVGSGATAKLGTPADGVRTRHGEGERDTRSTRGLCNFKGLWSLVSSDISFFSSNASLFFLSPENEKKEKEKKKKKIVAQPRILFKLSLYLFIINNISRHSQRAR